MEITKCSIYLLSALFPLSLVLCQSICAQDYDIPEKANNNVIVTSNGMKMKETDNTKLAREHLAKFTGKPVQVITLQEMAKKSGVRGIEGYRGAVTEREDRIFIAVNPSKPESHESSFVHELLHIILDYEGFPNVRINEQYAKTHLPRQLWVYLPKLRAKFSSALDHPEIYRRMRETYDLDMEAYFDGVLAQKVNRFNKKKWSDDQEQVFLNQQDILDGLEYFHYDIKQRTEILAHFEEKSNSAYNSCVALHKAIDKIGMYSPRSCRKSAEVIKAHILKYGEKRNLKLLNDMWKALDIE